MQQNFFDMEPNEDRDLLEREERCSKAIRTLTKAIIMRLLVGGILIWAVVCSDMKLWAVGLMVLVMVINIMGMLPLAAELKKCKAEWKTLLEEEE